jgi:phosphocarrier protein HPr
VSNFIKKKIQIRNSQGLHARPASLFVRIANKFESEVLVKKDDEVVNGKSIMGLLTLAANQGSMLEIEVSGPDAEAAMKALEDFLTSDEDDSAPPVPRRDGV